MVPRPPMRCEATDCQFETLSNDEAKDQYTEMQIHVQVRHTLVMQQQRIYHEHLRDRVRQDRADDQKIKVTVPDVPVSSGWPRDFGGIWGDINLG